MLKLKTQLDMPKYSLRAKKFSASGRPGSACHTLTGVSVLGGKSLCYCTSVSSAEL